MTCLFPGGIFRGSTCTQMELTVVRSLKDQLSVHTAIQSRSPFHAGTAFQRHGCADLSSFALPAVVRFARRRHAAQLVRKSQIHCCSPMRKTGRLPSARPDLGFPQSDHPESPSKCQGKSTGKIANGRILTPLPHRCATTGFTLFLAGRAVVLLQNHLLLPSSPPPAQGWWRRKHKPGSRLWSKTVAPPTQGRSRRDW
jgi:hypothetical protein